MKKLSAAILIILIFSSSCAQRHYITIDPHVPVTSKNIGHSKPVGLTVTDARSGNSIAQWKGRFYVRKFSVSPASDLTDSMREKVSEGLFRMGFHPRRIERETTRTLHVDILRLKGAYKEKLPALSVRIQAALRARCSNRDNRYSATYSDKKHLKSVPASTFPNENLINDTLAEALGKMFNDKKLLSCLMR
ncbi:hypothetical protein UZ36_05250 [Candidatus Nitromaritima sp. SCGC AAA799-C22]|nr:hypothetical protein UZ36_05250 [Candidatus Nitromaritima sp. SCGC AAA799-C22]